MKTAVVVVALLCTAGIWAWALIDPGASEGSLPPDFCGRFSFEDFRRPPGVKMEDPFRTGQEQYFVFREDGTYLYRVLVAGGYEMTRNEGTARIDEEGRLVIRQISENRTPLPEAEQVFEPKWMRDDRGDVLVLVGRPEGYQLFLRPVSEETGPSTSGRPDRRRSGR